MDFYIARAMQVGQLADTYQLEKVHEIENKIGRALINADVQRIFGLPELKYFFGIPDDQVSQRRHSERIRNELINQHLTKTEAGALVTAVDLESLHSFDWGVWNQKDELGLFYQGKTQTRSRKLTEAVDAY